MATKTITLSILIYCFTCTRGQFGLENLGEYINNQVQQPLRPLTNLNNLGAQINSEVQRELAPLRNLGARISSNVQQQTAPLYGLGSRISSNVNQQLSSLDNLDERIQQEVERGLEPVRIMESILKVKFGTDGTTVATFYPGETRFIIRNGVLYRCRGKISDSDGSCSGSLEKLNFDKKEDFCYSLNKSRINEWYCIVPTNGASVLYINGKITCQGRNNGPALLIRAEDFQEMCKNVGTSIMYKYYTNRNLRHVGNGLQCSGNNPQICTYSETSGNFPIVQGSQNIIVGY